MLSVVVPAAWGYEPFCNFLANVVELPVVGEVILINNNMAKTPDHPVLSHFKVHVYNQEENIFVNPAWNLGVSLATNDKICILSDDVLVDLRVFFEADRFVSKEIGILAMGIHLDLYRAQNNQYEEVDAKNLITTGDIKIKSIHDRPNTAGMGSLFFIHKENWVTIPEEFKVYWGDTWQSDMQAAYGRINYYINDCFYHTPWSMAVKSGVGCDYQVTPEFKQTENHEYYRIVKENKIEEIIRGKHGR